jgi:hypothetical protein
MAGEQHRPAFTTRGSTIKVGERYSGPPSKLYPVLRDLAEGDPDIKAVWIEFDLANRRTSGIGQRCPAWSEQPCSMP